MGTTSLPARCAASTMALKFKFKTKEEIPAEYQALYAEREGEWVLDCDGVAEKTKLDEFRVNNVALRKEIEVLVEEEAVA